MSPCHDVAVADETDETDDPGPAGSPYDWWVRASALLEEGSPAAAAQLLERLLREEPWSRSVREGLARALFDAGRFVEAVSAFEDLVDRAPDDDYALFGLGLSLWRLQRFDEAVDPLAMAAVMRPDRPEYGRALAQVRATLRAREQAGLPESGPVGAQTPAPWPPFLVDGIAGDLDSGAKPIAGDLRGASDADRDDSARGGPDG